MPPAAAKELRRRHRHEALGRHQEQRAGQDRGAGQHDEEPRPLDPIHQGTERPARQQGAAPDEGGTIPISDGLHGRCCASHVPRDGPSLPWMSPMKTLIRARWVVGAIGSFGQARP
ncbi:hypothetical protein ASG52_21035 [Methylobacterium sp. Leaf456]|nr:hypothetical protein ASG52_21035 [Methylobacterium sp. Leaf456]